MSGSKMTSMTIDDAKQLRQRGESLTDVAKLKGHAPHVWNGVDEDDRPLSREELRAGIEDYRKRRGRPTGSQKESTTIRFDSDVLAAFRSAGPGWQTRMNSALREWLATNPKVS
jgi:uncharacterized protein (DUF4415 family)